MTNKWGALLTTARELGWLVEESGSSGRVVLRAPSGAVIYASPSDSPAGFARLLERLRHEGSLDRTLVPFRVESDWRVTGELDSGLLGEVLDQFSGAAASWDALKRQLLLVWEVEAPDAAGAVDASVGTVRERLPFLRCIGLVCRRAEDRPSARRTPSEPESELNPPLLPLVEEIDLTGDPAEQDAPSPEDDQWMARLVDFEARLDEASRAMGGGAEVLAAAAVGDLGGAESLAHDYEVIQGARRVRLRVTAPSDVAEFADRAAPAIPLDTPISQLVELLRYYLHG